MKRSEIDASIKEDLIRIPVGENMQGELRLLYNSRRRSDLSLNKSRRETMTYCIEVIKKLNHGKEPEFDKTYFEYG